MSKLLQPIHEEREKYDEDSFEEMLNEIYGEVEICGYSYSAGYALKELDPIAYRCDLADMQEYEDVYICPICNDEHDDEEDALYCCQDLFKCPVCGDEYEDSEEAEACCDEEDD